MEYTIYHADGSFFMNVTCSADSLAAMIPDNGYSVEGTESVLSTCVGGTLARPTDAEISTHNTEEALIDFRIERNKRLTATDWTQGNDSPLSASVKTDYQTYRQNLRDMPQSDGFDPLNPVWPTLP
tara:strand:- start:73 stop:450 length:378 start_codon:yes stop_codon:yes gene_type:complete